MADRVTGIETNEYRPAVNSPQDERNDQQSTVHKTNDERNKGA